MTSEGNGLSAEASQVFGRCPMYIFVDTDTLEFEAVPNPAMSAAGGAGIQAAQFVIDRGVEAVVTGNIGPNAFNMVHAGGVPVYLFPGGTVRAAVEAFSAGKLGTAGGANVSAHAGTGRGVSWEATLMTPSTSPSGPEEISTLSDVAKGLRAQLAQLMERVDRLEKGQ